MRCCPNVFRGTAVSECVGRLGLSVLSDGRALGQSEVVRWKCEHTGQGMALVLLRDDGVEKVGIACMDGRRLSRYGE